MPRLSSGWEWLLLAAIALGTAAYLAVFMDEGVVLHDTGTLGHSAERVLQGELPHRDYDAVYTGILSYLHAGSFWLLGIHADSMRWTLLAFAVVFSAVVYRIARRVAPIPLALLTTFTALAWSLPNYFSPMPSWYNLFFATFGTLALLRYLETNRRRWLFLAGVCGGISLLFKVIGLYYVAAAGLLLVYRSQVTTTSDKVPRGWRFGAGVLTGLLGLFLALLFNLISYHRGSMEIIHFVLPGTLLAGFLMWNEWRLGGRGAGQRYRSLFAESAIFVAGMLPPIFVFLTPYLVSGSLPDLMRGLFVLPLKRLEFEELTLKLPPAYGLVWLLPLAGMLTLPIFWPRLARHRTIGLGVAALLAAVVVLAGKEPLVYRGVWYCARGMVPLMAGALVWLLGSRRFSQRTNVLNKQRIWLLGAMAAMVSLVQVPASNGIYFLYAAPMMILAALYLLAYPAGELNVVHASLGTAALLFALLWLNGGNWTSLDSAYSPSWSTEPLINDRCHLSFDPLTSAAYRQIIDLIDRHSLPGSYIYAAPDCPEIYFLANRKNPTRTFFDIFDDDFGSPAHTARILNTLDKYRVSVVVIRGEGHFSGSLDTPLVQGLQRNFPESFSFYISRDNKIPIFTVRWRDDVPDPIQAQSSASAVRHPLKEILAAGRRP